MKNDLLILGTKEIWRLATKEKLWGDKKGSRIIFAIVALYTTMVLLLVSGVALALYGGHIMSLPMVMVSALSFVAVMGIYGESMHCVAKVLRLVKEYKDKYGIPLVNQ